MCSFVCGTDQSGAYRYNSPVASNTSVPLGSWEVCFKGTGDGGVGRRDTALTNETHEMSL